MSSGKPDRGDDILRSALLGVKTDCERILSGVIGDIGDALKGSNSGAHGVGAAASDEAAAPHQARHPEFQSGEFHGHNLR